MLERDEASGWVLYKLDGGLDHILIDEAQDTSPEQWRDRSSAHRRILRGQRRARRREGTAHDFRGGRREAIDLQLPGCGSRPVRYQPQAFRGRAAENSFVDVQLLRFRAAPRRRFCNLLTKCLPIRIAREGVTSAGVDVAHQAHRTDAKGRVEFWPASPVQDARAGLLAAGRCRVGDEPRGAPRGSRGGPDQNLDGRTHAPAGSQEAHQSGRHHGADAATRTLCQRIDPPAQTARRTRRRRRPHQGATPDRGDGSDRARPLRASAGRRSQSRGAVALAADRNR